MMTIGKEIAEALCRGEDPTGQRHECTTQARAELEREVNRVIKELISVFEETAALPPEAANEPVRFNTMRNVVIRRVWGLAKHCIKYGTASVH